MGHERNSRDEGPPFANGLRAIVADDDPFARRMIKEALQRAHLVVIAEAQNGREAVELALHYRPDVVVMDVVMPELDGIAATRRIVKEQPDQVIVILTSADDEMGLLGLRAGASGFLTKDLDVDVLPRALQGVLTGEAAISRKLSMRLVEQLRRAPDGGVSGMRPVKSPLTPREWEVMDLLAESRTTDQIAEALVLSSETVKTHVKNILRKLEVRSREDAVAVAHRMRKAGGE